MTALSGVWPREQPRSGQPSEGLVWEALRANLPDGWTAWHSMKLRAGDGWEGEGDFVIAIPDTGLVVLEVKGGRIEQRDGIWYQDGRLMKKSPRTQAIGFAKLIYARLAAQKCHAPYGVATVFPGTSFDQPPTQDDLRDTVFGSHSLPHLCDQLRRNLKQIIPAGVERPRGPWMETLHSMWGETWVPNMSLLARRVADRERRISLDNKQAELLAQTDRTRKALISGKAGSGKTMLAREKAIRTADEGEKVLVLCFTNALANHLRDSIGRPNVTVNTVRKHAAKMMIDAELAKKEPDTAAGWEAVAKEAAQRAMPAGDSLPDLLIVDEAQDLSDNDWELVEKLAAGRKWWIFYDSAQQYWADRKLPGWTEDGWVMELTQEHRCSESIMAFASAAGGQELSEQDQALVRQAIDDGVIKIIEAANAATVTNAVEAQITSLLKEGLSAGDITVISLAGQTEPRAITRCKMLAGKTVAAADSMNAGGRLVAETFLRFKGLERPAVIVTDIHLRRDDTLPVRLYIALTRAQTAIRLVLVPGDLACIPQLQQFRKKK